MNDLIIFVSKYGTLPSDLLNITVYLSLKNNYLTFKLLVTQIVVLPFFYLLILMN